MLGLGAMVDYEVVWDREQMIHLARDWDISVQDLDRNIIIDSERSLLVALLGYMQAGRGGERHVANIDIIEEFAARFDHRVTLGGTCVRAAAVLSMAGIPSTVHLVSEDDTLRGLLPRGVDSISSATVDSREPHLIIQYPAGETIPLKDGVVSTRHPNRLIFTHDVANEELILSAALDEVVAKARVFLISGFNVMKDVENCRIALTTLSVPWLAGKRVGW